MARKIFRATDGFNSVDLLKYSRDHLRAAELLFSSHYLYYDSAAHLVHLSLELLLKAALLHRDGEFEAEHRLGRLLGDLKRGNESLVISAAGERTLLMLEEYEGSRYPNPTNPVDVGNEDLPDIRNLWEELLSHLPEPLLDSFRTADQFTKGERVLMVKTHDSEKRESEQSD